MTDASGFDDILGLAGTFPRPGWVVLDAARERRFTGEVVIRARTEFRVYLDRGRVYLAERDAEPSLGARLVDAGAINAAQLEHGAMRVGEHEHLGRLFDRVPSVDRQFVVIVTELMNETCLADVAAAQVSTITATPYRHHPAGIHHWDHPTGHGDLHPGDPLPAPEPADVPVADTPPESLFNISSNDTDTLVRWNEPSWLDDAAMTSRRRPTPVAAAHELEPAGVSVLGDDWADHLETTGLPEHDDDPLARPTPLPNIPTEQLDRFEVIWPSGEIDDDFDTAARDTVRDHDRVGPTARVARSAPTPPPDAADAETSDSPRSGAAEVTTPDPADDPAMSDDVALSVRRAVASIDTGSLDARRRLADVQLAPAPGPEVDTAPAAVPRTTVVRPAARPTSVWSARSPEGAGSDSVFDEPAPVVDDGPASTDTSNPAAAAAPTPVELDHSTAVDDADPEPARVSALRRLIGGLRRN